MFSDELEKAQEKILSRLWLFLQLLRSTWLHMEIKHNGEMDTLARRY